MNARLYDGARWTLGVLFRSFWRLKVIGAENVPPDGPLIVACNHVSYLDPPVLGTACPRRIQYMAKKELFHIPLLGPAIAAVGAYPVDRRGSASSAIKRSVEVLSRGGAVGIFPEGTRNRDGEAQIHAGVGLLAALAKAPVLPACVSGTVRLAPFTRFTVRFGEPLHLPPGKARREEMANFTERIMRAIISLAEASDR